MKTLTTSAVIVSCALSACATVTWNGVVYPTTTDEAVSLNWPYMLGAGDPTGTRDSSYTNYVRWSDQEYPHGDARYFVGTGVIIDPNRGGWQTIAGESRNNHVFYGKSLVIGGDRYIGVCAMDSTREDPVTFGEEGLVLANGSIRSWTAKAFLRGPFTVLNAGNKPMVIDAAPEARTGSSALLHFAGNWYSGDESQITRITRQSVPSWPQGVGPVSVFISGDMSGYTGLVGVETNCLLVLSRGLPNGSLQLGLYGYVSTSGGPSVLAPMESGLNGTLTTDGASGETLVFKNLFSQGGSLYVPDTNKWHVAGTLKFNGGILDMRYNPSATNESSLTAGAIAFEGEDKVRLRLHEVVVASDTNDVWKILSGPAGSFSMSDFLVERTDGMSLQVETTGGRSVLTARRAIRVTGSFPSIDDSQPRGTLWDSAKDANGNDFWQDGLAPHGDADYYIFGKQGLPRTASHFFDKFAGRSLTVADDASFLTGNSSPVVAGLRVDDLRVGDGVSFVVWSGETVAAVKADHHNYPVFRLAGGLTTLGTGVTSFCPFNGYLLALESDLHGIGTIELTMYKKGYSGPVGALELSGDNSDFAGQILFTMANGTRKVSGVEEPVPNDSYFVTTYVAHGSSLGGALPAFRHDAVLVENYSLVQFDESAVLGSANRGLCVKQVGRFHVLSGDSFAVTTPLTLHGELRKEGPGLMALGGRLRFGLNDDIYDVTAPTVGSNRLCVLEGGLKPLSTNAWDGADVCVSAAGRLVYDINPAGVGMREYGPVNVRGLSPLTLSGTEKAVVTLDMGSDMLGSETTLALGTFADMSTANSFRNRLDVKRPCRASIVETSVRANADGTATVLCSVYRTGFLMTIK